MKVHIKVQPLGLYNGQPLNAKAGDTVDLPNELAAGLVAGGLATLVAQDEDAAADDASSDRQWPEDGDPSGDWTAKQLKAWAKAHDVDLGGATRKDDILDALAAAQAIPTAGDGEQETATADDPDGQTATPDDAAEQRPADEAGAEKRG